MIANLNHQTSKYNLGLIYNKGKYIKNDTNKSDEKNMVK